MSFQETFGINYYFHYFYCLFMHGGQNKVSHNLGKKTNYKKEEKPYICIKA